MDDNVARFRAFVKAEVGPHVRTRGFRGSGHRFRAQRGANTVTIAFQRRSEFFTCNLGVISARIAATKRGFKPIEHYEVRLGPIAVGYDKWWDLTIDPRSLASDFLPALDKGLDYLEGISTDDGLRAAILRNIGPDPRNARPVEISLLLALDGDSAT